PDLARADLLLIDGSVTEGITLESAAATEGAPPEEPELAPASVVETRAQKKERYRRQYDQVWLSGQSEEHFGILRSPGNDLFDLEQRDEGRLEGVVVNLLEFSITDEKVKPPEATFGSDALIRVTKVRLADTLKNRVARAVRAVPADAAHALDREKLIDELLLWARDEAWVYDVALEQAEVLASTDAGLTAVRAKARVLRNKGDLAGELALYESLPETGPSGAFRYEGLGILQGRLGLHSAAVDSLQKASALAPTDARPHAALALFLRQRSEPQQAYAMAQRAMATLGSVSDQLERLRVIQVAIGGLLGMGDLEGAREALSKFGSHPAGTLPAALAAQLRATIDYAAGSLAAAKDGFRTAAASRFGPAAQLGLAACQLRLGEWAEAKASFDSVVDDAPLLRHTALAGLSLLYLRLGQFENAATQADRALEADPLYAYAHYLKARALAGLGQTGNAVESLDAVLRLRDDFVPALAEVSEQRMRLLRDGDASEQAQNALAAVRYADRAVALSPVPSVMLRERQGLAHFATGDLRGAQDAFAAARDAAADDQGRLFAQAALAVVDYAMDHVDEARSQLERMQSDLAREHPMRQWATETLSRIEDHAQKEQLDDRFERSEIGNVWNQERDGGLGAEVVENRLLFRGRFSRAAEVFAWRAGAVQKGGKFLATSARMTLLPNHQAQDTFAGVRIQSRGSGSTPDFQAQIGLRDGRPFWMVREGKADPVQSPPGGEVAAPGEHTFLLRVEDRGDKMFALLLVMDGVVLQRKDLTMLRAADSKELDTVLVVSGRAGSNVDVAFDDYHLERRKD
ncbi:MAG: tetratricopeptide repeat protein, partial [Planctomycetota bacterium]